MSDNIDKLNVFLDTPESREASIKFLEEYLQEELKIEEDLKLKTSELHVKLLDENSLDPYIKELNEKQKNSEQYQQIQEFWTLVETAERYGKLIDTEDCYKINDFISEMYHYKDYIFGIMHGQGSVPWFAPYREFKHILGPEQLSFNF